MKGDKRSQQSKEHANAAIGGETRVEYQLASLKFPKAMEMLSDPNVWIADSATTVHMTANENGAISILNKSDQNDANSITMGNGANESMKKMVNIPWVICDKNGNEVMPATLVDVFICSSSKFNLFSVSKMIQD